MDVTQLRWPDEQRRRAQFRDVGALVLLVVGEGTAPPADLAGTEDWIRLPAGDADVAARIDGLRRRGGGVLAPPDLDDDGLLRVDGRWVSLPPVEARLNRALLGRFGAVVSRDTLAGAGWPAGAPGRNALDVHVLRLRRRVAGVDLAIRTVRSRGYLLEHRSDFVQQAVRQP
ncbi:hypothetical protein BH20ACT2_BH20ACT2_23380 [soil metagenome]